MRELGFTVGAVAVLAVTVLVLGVRPRVGTHRLGALVLAAPGALLAAAGVALTAMGSAEVTVPLWSAAAVCLAAGWAFWPGHDRHWHLFEREFRAHVERDGA